jgi:hypothetical protein
MANTPAEPPDSLADQPPFWSWGAIYALVLGATAVEVIVFAVLSRVLR